MKSVSQAIEVEKVKTVGQFSPGRRLVPIECHGRALALMRQANRLNPQPQPRGFVFKAVSWKAYETWRRRQKNPRLW